MVLHFARRFGESRALARIYIGVFLLQERHAVSGHDPYNHIVLVPLCLSSAKSRTEAFAFSPLDPASCNLPPCFLGLHACMHTLVPTTAANARSCRHVCVPMTLM